MFEVIEGLIMWAVSFPSEPEGMGSMSRVVSFGSAAAVLLAFLWHVYANGSLPSGHQSFGLAVLMAAGQIPYALNQLQRAVGGPRLITLPRGDDAEVETHAVGFMQPVDDEDEDDENGRTWCK